MVSSLSYSQIYNRVSICEECYYSLEVGGVNSIISGVEDSSPKLGLYAGIFEYIPISEKLAIRAGATYSNIGSKVKDFDTPIKIHSINTPVSLHYRFKENLQFFGGGELGSNFHYKLPMKKNSDQEFEIVDSFKPIDFSAFLGIGYILLNHIDFNLKYNLGFTNLNNGDNFNENPLKKNWLTLSVGYTFRED